MSEDKLKVQSVCTGGEAPVLREHLRATERREEYVTTASVIETFRLSSADHVAYPTATLAAIVNGLHGEPRIERVSSLEGWTFDRFGPIADSA
jgi:hypothetical protein